MILPIIKLRGGGGFQQHIRAVLLVCGCVALATIWKLSSLMVISSGNPSTEMPVTTTTPPPNHDPRTGKSRKDTTSLETIPEGAKTILLYTTFFEEPKFATLPGYGHSPFQQLQCPISNCYVTSDKTLLDNNSVDPPKNDNHMGQFDAVMFHLPNFDRINSRQIRHIQQWRQPHQRFVAMSLESPDYPNYHFPYRLYQNFFNWTMTYRWDSDIPMPYGMIVPKQRKNTTTTTIHYYNNNNNHQLKKKIWNPTFDYHHFESTLLPHQPPDWHALATRPKKIAWVVSNCHANSQRLAYVKELQQYIQVDIYGKCGSVPCGRGNASCFVTIPQEYKFYLAFENDLCVDYLTEKFFQRQQRDNMLLVVRGPPQSSLDQQLPPHSYINARNFASPQALAAYLHRVDQNSTLYLSYFWWQTYYEIQEPAPYSWCWLCQKLHADVLQPKVYSDLQSWWESKNACDRYVTDFVHHGGWSFFVQRKLNRLWTLFLKTYVG